ncbi:hypothetical protein Hthe01_18550 [Hydrogenophilus thermoluteolus]|nr:hypothetical protein Hthe01_18550 [Hydrogenophilus thermoluteolus]
MGFSHTMRLKARIAPGVTVEDIAEALHPIAEYNLYSVFDALVSGERYVDDEFLFDPGTRELSVATYGKVGYNYYDILEEVADRLGRIVSEPGEIWLYDHDTGDIENAKCVFVFGPSEEAIKAYLARRDIEAGLRLMEPHLAPETIAAIRRLVGTAIPTA